MLSSNNEEHNHHRADQVLTKAAITENVKRGIRNMIEHSLKPRAISHKLRQGHQQYPTSGQVC